MHFKTHVHLFLEIMVLFLFLQTMMSSVITAQPDNPIEYLLDTLSDHWKD